MSEPLKKSAMDELAESLDIPETAYRKAEARYEDLGRWFSRDEAHCAQYDPHIFPQGSFRLGTVVRAEEYDLDFGCRLRIRITKATHTQEELKELVRLDLEAYRRTRGIEHPLEEKNRCWRVRYKDELQFHMDGVPSIPENQHQQQILEAAMVKYGTEQSLANEVARHAGAITDNRMRNYRLIDPYWKISNSEGYAKWFEYRMKLASAVMKEAAIRARAATVDELPARMWKSPLQQSIQILKCHRDRMFEDAPDSKPISVIITTLAAEAYQGEYGLSEALEGILSRMGTFVRPQRPRVPNPVNPVEDFADKWYDIEYKPLKLEEHFWLWLRQAQTDFRAMRDSRDPDFVTEQAMAKFGAPLDASRLRTQFGIAAPVVITTPKTHVIVEPPKPWLWQ